MPNSTNYDAIVIGGGHNGLTAACYLARAGKRVLVAEALDRLGGFCTTDSYVPDAPGFRFSPHAMDHVLTAIEPSIISELDLPGFGLDMIEIDPFGGWVDRDGSRLVLWRDLRRTLDGIHRLHPDDAIAYEAFIGLGRKLWRIALPYLMDHPTRPRPATLWRILRGAVAARGDGLALGRLAVQPAAAMIAARFTHPALRSLLTNLAASGGVPLDAAGSAILATVLAIEHEHGVFRPRGGSAGLPNALAACARHHGAELCTGAPVERIVIERNRAVGIVLEGRLITATAILAAIDPVSLAERLIGLPNLPQASRRELHGLGQYRSNLAMGAIGARLAEAPSICGIDVPPTLLAASLFLGPDADGIADAVAEARSGRIPAQLPIWLILPSIADRSLVPPGAPGETLYVYLPVLPRRLAAGSWHDAREALFASVMQTAEHHLPGLSNLVLERFVHSPDDLPGWSYDNRGGPYHADLSLDQLGPWRPVPSFSGYRTPIKALYHAGAGAHPLGTLNGWSGRSAARLILRA